MIPLLIFCIVANALLKKISVFDVFLNGAGEGIKIAVNLIPTMIGLFVGISLIRESGFLEWLSNCIGGFLEYVGVDNNVMPSQLLPVIFMRPFSASAATALVLDLFESFGPDSFIGFAASLILSCSETLFYTVSVYFGAIGVTKTGYIIPGGLITSLVAVVTSMIMAHLLM